MFFSAETVPEMTVSGETLNPMHSCAEVPMLGSAMSGV